MVLCAYLWQNNKAASLIEDGEYNEAIAVLSKLLKTMKQEADSESFYDTDTCCIDRCMITLSPESNVLQSEEEHGHQRTRRYGR